MIIDCISDLHGYYPKLEGGDLLIVAGDLTATHTIKEYGNFKEWFYKQTYTRKILIAGNHDTFFEGNDSRFTPDFWFSYLEDSGTEFEGLKIWGSPWTKTFPGMNPACKAFTLDTEEELAEKWALIPDDIDILITHSPPYGILDTVTRDVFIEGHQCDKIEHVGSNSLRKHVLAKVKPKLWIVGHIHEDYGEFKDETLDGTSYHIINASHVNERYEPVNKPIRVII